MDVFIYEYLYDSSLIKIKINNITDVMIIEKLIILVVDINIYISLMLLVVTAVTEVAHHLI